MLPQNTDYCNLILFLDFEGMSEAPSVDKRKNKCLFRQKNGNPKMFDKNQKKEKLFRNEKKSVEVLEL